MKLCAAISFVFLAACPGLAVAEVFKWTDADGRIHYGDRPPQNKAAVPVKGTSNTGTTALAEVVVEESKMKYFPVYGATPRELQASILTNGPFNQIVQRHVNAECGWRLNWKFEHIQEKNQCRIGKFKIILSTEITFPQWMNPEAADDTVRTLWKKVAHDIRVHEDGHKANGVQAANILARRLKALPPHDSCEALNAEISREGARIHREHALLDRAYDRTEVLKIKPGGRFAP